MELCCFTVIYEVIYDNKVDFHSATSCVAPPPPSPQTPEKKVETSVGDVCLLNFIGVRCFQNAPRCLFFLDLRRKDEGGGRRGGEGREVEVEKSRKSPGRTDAKSAKEQECPAEGGIVSRRFLCFRGSGLILPSVALLSR